MAQGPLDHPSYLTRQAEIFGKTTAGANTIQFASNGLVFPYDVRIRNIVAVVGVAGTSASPGSAVIMYCPGTSIQYPGQRLTNNIGTNVAANGSAATVLTTNTTTTTLGFVALGTSVANTVLQSGDMNVSIPAGQQLVIKNGTDATMVAGSVAIEFYIEPVTASWTGTN
jgi:hypothetical protein